MKRTQQQQPLRSRQSAMRARQADAEDAEDLGDLEGADRMATGAQALGFLDQMSPPQIPQQPAAGSAAAGLGAFNRFIVDQFAQPSQPGSSRGATSAGAGHAADPGSPIAVPATPDPGYFDVPHYSPISPPTPASSIVPPTPSTAYFGSPPPTPFSPATPDTGYFRSPPVSPPAASAGGGGGGGSGMDPFLRPATPGPRRDDDLASVASEDLFRSGRHVCGTCHQGFSSKKNLDMHVRVHTGERPYVCSECGSAFKQRSHLSQHKTTHTGERRFKCRHCEASFTRAGARHQHERNMHPPARPDADGQGQNVQSPASAYVCRHDGCGKTLASSGALRNHELTHRNKEHQCRHCDQSFIQKSQLTRHELTHTGEKPHRCDECGQRFARKDHLLGHKRNMHAPAAIAPSGPSIPGLEPPSTPMAMPPTPAGLEADNSLLPNLPPPTPRLVDSPETPAPAPRPDDSPDPGNRNVYMEMDDESSNRRGIAAWAAGRLPFSFDDQTGLRALTGAGAASGAGRSGVQDSGVDAMSDSMSRMSVSGDSRGPGSPRNDSAYGSGAGASRGTAPGSGRTDPQQGSSRPGGPLGDLSSFVGGVGGTSDSMLDLASKHTHDQLKMQDKWRNRWANRFRQIKQSIKRAAEQTGLYEPLAEREARLRQEAQEDERRQQREEEFLNLRRDYEERERQAEARGESPPPEPERLSRAREYDQQWQSRHARAQAEEQARHARLRDEAHHHGLRAVQAENTYRRNQAEAAARQQRPAGRGHEAAVKKTQRSQQAIAAQTQGLRHYAALSHYDMQVRLYENRLQEASRLQLAGLEPLPALGSWSPPAVESRSPPTLASQAESSPPTLASQTEPSPPTLAPQAGSSRSALGQTTHSVAAGASSSSAPALNYSGGLTSSADLRRAIMPVMGGEQALQTPRVLASTMFMGIQANPGVNSVTFSAMGQLPGTSCPEPITVTAYRGDGDGDGDAGVLAARLRVPVAVEPSPGPSNPDRSVIAAPVHRAVTMPQPPSNRPVLDWARSASDRVAVQFSGQANSTGQVVADRLVLRGDESGAQLDVNPTGPFDPHRYLDGPRRE